MNRLLWCVPGVAVLGLGVFIALTPGLLFPVCEADHLGWAGDFRPTMRCFWLGQTEMVLGACIAVAGVALLLRPGRDSAFVAGCMLLALGSAVILVSLNGVIGSLCGHPHSRCQIGTKPALRLAGAPTGLLGAGLLLRSMRQSKSS
jgi:hypothetical protein